MLEKSTEIEPDQNIQATRVMMLELERVYSHLVYLYDLMSCLEDDVIMDILISMRYLLIDCFEEIVGHRMFGTANIFYGLSFNLTPGNIKLINETTQSLDKKTKTLRDLCNRSTSISSLFNDLATISSEHQSPTGPLSWYKDSINDLRVSNPYLLYGDDEVQAVLKDRKIEIAEKERSAYNRIFTIITDVKCSLKIIELISKKYSPSYQLSDKLPELKIPANIFLEQIIEAPRGELRINTSTDRNSLIETLDITSPSDINKNIIPYSLKGIRKDYIEIAFKSLYISPMEIDK
jgi:Ni,Fe-hydrogenase III large subunit